MAFIIFCASHVTTESSQDDQVSKDRAQPSEILAKILSLRRNRIIEEALKEKDEQLYNLINELFAIDSDEERVLLKTNFFSNFGSLPSEQESKRKIERSNRNHEDDTSYLYVG